MHGSRDYFKIRKSKSFVLEVVPVLRIKKPSEAENITDLSYFHVNYVKKKFPNKIFNEIILAKTFCHANKCYGAESYINGFSGYGLEVLVYYYGSFVKFVTAISKIKKGEKKVIDVEKHFKNRSEVLMDLNSSKLQSPIIFVDPTFKQRNVLAALSEETFQKFQKACKDFLKNPKIECFVEDKVDFKKLEDEAKRRKNDFILLNIKTNKQRGDIAGSKLLKFYKHLEKEISKCFNVNKSHFEYDNEKSARCFFSVKTKKGR